MKSLIFAGTKGIGRSIAKKLSEISTKTFILGSKECDTSKISNVNKILSKYKKLDVIVLNTGGPPAKNFYKISYKDWIKYFNQLFLFFVLYLQKVSINKGGYIFLISSLHVKEPNEQLILSNCYRIALISVIKSLSKIFVKKDITFINIAPGPTKTNRFNSLLKKNKININSFKKKLNLNNIPEPDEISEFIKTVVEKKIKSLNGQTIGFDSGINKFIF
jgi:3-oxoacyl-[acyl-carrier protein] reductase